MELTALRQWLWRMSAIRLRKLSLSLTIAPAVALALASLGVLVVLQASPRSPREIAAVFPPWWSQAQSLSAAREAGVVSAIGGMRNVVIVVADDNGLPRRLNAAGALLQLDPVLSGLCAQTSEPAHV